MRAIYVMLVAAVTILECSNAHSLPTDADRTQLSRSVVSESRFLRINKVVDDEERMSYSNIFGVEHDLPSTINVLTDFLNNGRTIQHVAKQMKVKEFNEGDKNWNALIQYVIMKHWRVKREHLTSEEANAILRTIF
ncbi:RxLR effector protein [Phytophthora megakarya]|uniref:RxLR effector protein n=1 Tax=Phytophthora megakarya TaxID=4795 RepID=A0A225UQI6_9STRA|nr:RxLR effector protein [Phytophthora megakarya]